MKRSTTLKKNQLRTYLLVLVLLAWGGLLAACGEATSTAGTGAAIATATSTTVPATTAPATTIVASTTAPATTVVPATLVATLTPAATVTPVATTTQAAVATSTPVIAARNPIIRFSASAVKVGETMTISGSGYPANTKLKIALLKGTSSQPFGSYATPTTDAQGNFSAKVKFASYNDAKSLEPGAYRVLVKADSASGNGPAASAPLTLLAAQDVATQELQQARATLSAYLNALANKRYSEAAKYFGGDVKAASAVFEPGITDAVKLFEKGCAPAGGYQCLPVKSINQGKQTEPGRYDFLVELVGRDGKTVVVWPAGSPQEARSQFSYSVAKTPNGYTVVSPPVFFS